MTSPFGGQFDAKCSFFLAFEGSFLRRRRLGGGEAKKMNKIIEMPF